MGRRPRRDEPGSWHHVVNRAIAKRPYFEARSDMRFFLAQVATEVRAGRLEVHAFCLMTTHFHLLVRSPVGELSGSMQRIQNVYSRHFNRLRRRDGPLIRARYYSKRVDSDSYRRAVVRYIDANAVRAGLVRTAADYEFGSARYFAGARRPPWLSSAWIVPRALELTGARSFDARTYRRAFGPRDAACVDATVELVEARMASARDLDPLDDLIGRKPAHVRDWMRRKALLADGMEIGLPLCGPTTVGRAIARYVVEHGDWIVERDGRAWRGSEVAHAGLLRDVSAASFEQIGRVLGRGTWAATRRANLHRELMRGDASYSARLSEIAGAAIGEVGLD